MSSASNICYKCRKLFSTKENQLLNCNYCTLHWHMECVYPILTNAPEADWKCPRHQVHANPKKTKNNSNILLDELTSFTDSQHSTPPPSSSPSQEDIMAFGEADEIVRYGGVVYNFSAKSIEDDFLRYAKKYRGFTSFKNGDNPSSNSRSARLQATQLEAKEWLDSLASFQMHETKHDGIQMLIDAAQLDNIMED